ncbi:hypothetical protein AVEN_195629-1 [Araneus ventricosus]|uniref:Uncharacterized protein n=1 Tax=Araneus ventricosus TaxID=182803 RepID=A0A4Y2B9A5_ARAVE|nr:hypothetical protein AVEN_195629-1 [Araneus ventricosus]
MEKDYNKEVSDSDDSPGENADDEELSIIDKKMLLIAKERSLQQQLDKISEELHMSRQMLAYFQDSLSHDEISQLQTSPLERCISPIASPIHKSENLPEDTFENLPDSPILAGSLRQPGIVSCDAIEALGKQSKNISNKILCFEAIMEKQIKLFQSNSPPKPSNNETQASGSYIESDTRYETAPNLEIVKTNVGSGRYYVGKGKEAANENFRYKKRSKTASSCDSPGKEAENPIYRSSKTSVSSCEPLAKDSPVKRSEEAFSTPEKKTLDSQSTKAELTRISPAMKRQRPDSNKKDLDESCARTSVDDDLKIAKKLKSEDDEKVSRQYPTLTELLSQKNHESIDLAQFMDQPQTDQTSNEWEQLNLPSTSGLSNVVGCISNSEESSLASGSEDVLLSERGESSLTSGSNISPGGSGESSLMGVSEDTSRSGNGESQHFQS